MNNLPKFFKKVKTKKKPAGRQGIYRRATNKKKKKN